MELLELPSELIPQYALSLNLGEINNLCRTSKEFNQSICANEHFWKLKFTHDYRFTPEYNGSWLKLYQNYNSLWSFGWNHDGQLGLGDQLHRTAPTQIPSPGIARLPFKAKAISCGQFHTVLIDLNDDVWSFGNNIHDQLGSGDQERRLTPAQIPRLKAKAVSCGEFHTVLIDLDDNVWTFGYNDSAQLGLGNREDRSTPTQIPQPGTPRLPFKAKTVSAGGYHTVLIDLDNNVWGFGMNRDGQLGLGDFRLISTPKMLSLKAKSISAGESHTVLIDLDDNVWSFGRNQSGQLGLGDELDRLIPTQIPHPDALRHPFKAKAVSAGMYHTVLIDLNDNIWSFGQNDTGQLGLGDHQDRLTPTMIPRLKAKTVSAGGYHTLLIDLDDNVWSFGLNEDGRLGLGDQRDRLTPTLILPPVSPKGSRESNGTRLAFKAKAISAGGAHTGMIATLINS